MAPAYLTGTASSDDQHRRAPNQRNSTCIMSGTGLRIRPLMVKHGTREETMWLGLAVITLAAAIGFNVLDLAIQDYF